MTEKVFEDKPCVGGSLADTAVGDCGFIAVDAFGFFVDFFEFGEVFECAVGGVDGGGPRNGSGSRDVSSAEGAFVGIVGHVHTGTGEFFG